MQYDLYDRILGSLIGGAAGDAMGAATEARSHGQILEYFGYPVRDFETPPCDTFGKGNIPGQVTDDFSSAYFLARSILDHGGKPDRAAAEAAFIDWSEHPQFFDRFAGPTTRAAIRRMKDGIAAEAKSAKSTVRQTTNGSAMRIAPVGMLHPGDWEGALEDTLQVTLLTHDNYLAISGACAVACAVSEALLPDADPISIIRAAFWGAREGEKRGREISHDVAGPSLTARLEHAIFIALGEGTADERCRRISDEIGCGLHVCEAIPAAIGLFAISPEDPVQAIVNCVNAGYDTDTMATMAGAIAGAFHGAHAFPTHYLPTLTAANGLPIEKLAQDITAIAAQRTGELTARGYDRKDRTLGCVLGAAAGDAMGAATENLSTAQIQKIFGHRVTGFETPVEGTFAYGRQRGQVTDAFSMGYVLGKHLQENGGRAETHIGVEALRDWGESEWFGPFAGMTTRNAVNRLNSNESMSQWSYSGILGTKLYKGHYYALSSNGAAVKAWPAALFRAGTVDAAIRDTVELTMASHDDPFSISGACAVSAALSRALAPEATLYDMVRAAIHGARQGELLARHRRDILDYPGPSVVRRLRMAVCIAVTADEQHAMEQLRDLIGCGPAISETVPVAFGLLIAHGGDVRAAMEDAVNIGDETAAIASLVGQLGGALNGAAVFTEEERRLLDEANGFDLMSYAARFWD